MPQENQASSFWFLQLPLVSGTFLEEMTTEDYSSWKLLHPKVKHVILIFPTNIITKIIPTQRNGHDCGVSVCMVS